VAFGWTERVALGVEETVGWTISTGFKGFKITAETWRLFTGTVRARRDAVSKISNKRANFMEDVRSSADHAIYSLGIRLLRYGENSTELMQE